MDMKKMLSICARFSTLALVASCNLATDEPLRIDVASTNVLGVKTLELERVDEPGDTVFELRGLDAEDRAVAGVHMRIGEIADLPDLLPTTETFGSELVLSMGSFEERTVSREVSRRTVLPVRERALQEFLELDVVTSNLATHAGIVIVPSEPKLVADVSYTTQTCPAEYMNQQPLAVQCCYSPTYKHNLFINATGKSVYREGPYTACRSQSGGACSGAACYYGPNGFSRPVVGGNAIGIKQSTSGDCQTGLYLVFDDVNGEFPNGQGCPGGASGAGDWDY